MSTDV
jgi:hypothetical protein